MYGNFVKKHVFNILRITVVLSFFVSAFGCGGGTKESPGINSSTNQIVVSYEKIAATEPTRPDWINEIPSDADNMHFMVGLSDFFTSEKRAREVAMKGARVEYARYTGVEIFEIDEVARFLEGQESQVLDAKIKAQSRLIQKTDAEVSRIKAKIFYIETFKKNRNGVYSGDVYKCWVLVTIPSDEDRRVAEWREKKKQAAAVSLNRLRKTQKQKVVQAQNELDHGRIFSALGIMQQQQHVLVAEKNRFATGPAEYKSCLVDIELLELELNNSGREMVSRIFLDPGRFGEALLQAGRGGEGVSVWAWIRTGVGVRPVGGLPLILQNQQGSIVARSSTKSTGEAVFLTELEVAGPMSVKVDKQADWVGQLPVNLQNGLMVSSCRINVILVGTDLSHSVQHAVQKLFSNSSHIELAAKQVLLGPMTYHASGLGGEFSELLKRRLRLALKEVDGLVLIEPRHRNVAQIERAVKSRGKALAGLSIGSSAMQAVMDGAQASLEGVYVVQADGVRLDLSLHQASTNRVLAASSVQIPFASIDSGMELIPAKAESDDITVTKTPNSINVEITSNYGHGYTYVAGETVSYFAHVDRDAYLLMVYEDVAGNLLQIFPNKESSNKKFKAQSTIKVPAQNDSFEFEISAPFGREQVFVFASTVKFPELPGELHSSGLKVLNVDLDRVLEMMRGKSSRSRRSYGEARTLLTTVARK